MEQFRDIAPMLELMDRAAFCVKDGSILHVNEAAKRLMITPDTPLEALLSTGAEEYAAFQGGCLYLTVQAAARPWGASVTRMGEYDIFRLEEENDQAQLHTMALAARELRIPLNNIMSTADQLFPIKQLQDDPAAREQAARMNRGLFQLLRIVTNMSDAARYNGDFEPRMETVNITSLLDEIFRKVQHSLHETGVTIHFSNNCDSVFSLADSEMLERAVFNILSNAVKFTPAGGCIDAKLTQRGKMLCLTVQDTGSGIPEELRGNIHNRYRRSPNLEDSRHGLGLGMVLIRSAAAAHGGTVLIDHPNDTGTRITLTLAINQHTGALLRSPVFRIDYAGERDHLLMELSQCLPLSLYDPEKIN